MNEIINKTNFFLNKLKELQNKLNNLNTEVNNKSEQISNYLGDFFKNISKQIEIGESKINNESKNYIYKKQNIYKINNKKDKVEEAYISTIKNIYETIKQLKYRIYTEKQGQKFINDNQKYLTIMVFGSVKAGKSSLGNFFAGKNFINTPFNNLYKHIYKYGEKPLFETQESGREKDELGRDTGITTDESGNTWFSEGVTDTTGAIQYFTLNGLRWIDSPGTGAVAKEDDFTKDMTKLAGTGAVAKEDDFAKDMTKLVEEYINYTDMCIFLMNSSEPGLQDDMKYIQKLNKEGQESLIVITKSDKPKFQIVIDENGKKCRKTIQVAKDESNRKDQEDDICKRLKKEYPSIDEKKYRAISISTLLANEAIKTGDEQKFRDSNLDKLIEIICKKMDDAPTYKRRNPIKLLNNFIDNVNTQIEPLENNIDKLIEEIKKYKDNLTRCAS